MIIIYFKRLYIKIQNTITFDMQNLSKNKKKNYHPKGNPSPTRKENSASKFLLRSDFLASKEL
jgi:hypothetical protein